MSSSKPRYLQIYDELKRKIQNRSYEPGDLLPPESQLCATYGTSRPTVAKAIARLCEEKRVTRRAGFGTLVLESPTKAFKVGLLLPQLKQTEIFEPICASIAATAVEDEVRIVRPLELGSDQDPKLLAEVLTERFIAMQVNGVFFTPVEHVEDQERFNLGIIERLQAAGIQVVLLDRDVYPWPRQTPFDLIGIDNIEAGYIMAGHLITNGCERLAFVAEANPAATVQLRGIGAREAMLQNGFSPRSLQNVIFDPARPEFAMEQLRSQKATGVVCANDVTAAALLRTMIDSGVRVPEEVQVCGFDDVQYASLLSVPLTSYRQPCADIGRVAMKTMVVRIQKPYVPAKRITLRGSLVARRSTVGREAAG